ncbi:hypothetical protein [Sphingopyxis terrae]|uniref:hypothetical protein n=1 Tax=Sphingopyxis terrae TaxID=33052 RepID=UPI000B20B4BE|nr:hypothetical protein [Sphingopyxis terrae]
MRLIKILAAAGGMVMSVGGCTSGEKATIEVHGHVFLIPKEHLVQGVVPWLPASQSEGLKFIINPIAQPEEQMIVTVGSASTTCNPRTPPTSNQLASACAAALQSIDSKSVADHFEMEKIIHDGDHTQWEYRVKGRNDVIASCYALDDSGSAGLCTSINHYEDLIYSIGLRDSDMRRLPQILAEVDSMLTSWEKKPDNG